MLKLAFTFILILAMSTVARAEAEPAEKPENFFKILAQKKSNWESNIAGQCARASNEKYTQALVHNPCYYSNGRRNGDCNSTGQYHGGMALMEQSRPMIEAYDQQLQAQRASWGGFDYENCTGRLPIGEGQEVTLMSRKIVSWHTPNGYGLFDIDVKFNGGNSSYPLSVKIQGAGGSMQMYVQSEGHFPQITFLDVPYLRLDPRTSRYTSPDSSFSIGGNDLVKFFNVQLQNCTWTFPIPGGNKRICVDSFFPLEAGLRENNIALVIKYLKEYLMLIEPPKPAPAAAPTPPVKAKKRTK